MRRSEAFLAVKISLKILCGLTGRAYLEPLSWLPFPIPLNVSLYHMSILDTLPQYQLP